MTTKRRIKATAWDLIERVKELLKGDKVKLDGVNEANTSWIQGEMLEPDWVYDHDTPEGEEKVVGWQMCFVGGLASAEHLLLTPGVARENLQNIHNGNLQTQQGKDALVACAKVIKEQFPERAERTLNRSQGSAQSIVIDFNDDERTTLADVYTVLDKAAVILAEQGK